MVRAACLILASSLLCACGLVLDLDPPTPDGGVGGECAPGESEMIACGRCGTESRTCSSAGRWVGAGCTAEGMCAPGETAPACSFCPDRTLVCDAMCQWPQAPAVCCAPGMSDVTGDGCRPGLVRPRSCDDACGYDLGDCAPVAPDPFVVVPFGRPPEPARLTLRVSTYVALADVYFLFDESASLLDDRTAVIGAVVSMLDTRSCDQTGVVCTRNDECAVDEVCSRVAGECIESPATTGCLAELWSGVGAYLSEPRNVLSSQPSPEMTRVALTTLGTIGGAEALFRAALAVAEPALVPTVTGCTGPGPGAIGCPALRENARRLLLIFTDEGNAGPPTARAAGAALRRQGITTVLFNVDGGDVARPDLLALATEAGSVSPMGVPYVYDVDNVSIVSGIERALDEALTLRPQRVTIAVYDDPADGVDATRFVDYFEVNTTTPMCEPGLTADGDGDGRDDTFVDAIPGDRLCFDLVARTNDTVPETPDPQLFRLFVEVLGDGVVIDRVAVTFVVPGTN